MDMRIFAKRLKSVRLQRNITVDELAEGVKVNRSTINRYESAGFKSIKEDKLEAIANYLSVDKEYLSGNTEEKYSIVSLSKLKERKNIEIKSIVSLNKEILKQKNITLDGRPINDSNIEYLIDTFELALEMLKKKNDK